MPTVYLMITQSTHPNDTLDPQQPPHPLDPTRGGDQTETDFRLSQDRPDPAEMTSIEPEVNNRRRRMLPLDEPAEGSRDEIEHSIRPEPDHTMPVQTGPDTSNAGFPSRDQEGPTSPGMESDDRLDHVSPSTPRPN